MKIFDISLPIKSEMAHWPGDPPVSLETLSAISNGDNANVTLIQMSVHTGTHIDAPKHFLDHGRTIDQLPLDKLMGETLVMEIPTNEKIISGEVLSNHTEKTLLAKVRRVLFKTTNSQLWMSDPAEFHKDYVAINTEGAEFLANLGLDLVGLDYLSIAPYDETTRPHQILLSKDIILLEGICLEDVQPGIYQMFCLPLNIENIEGAPARAILIQND